MNWFVMRLPESGGIGVVPETALEHYRLRGWLRVSEALGRDERDQLRLSDYAQAPDLDAPEPEPTKPAKQAQAAKTREK
jgi:hypothetical protein